MDDSTNTDPTRPFGQGRILKSAWVPGAEEASEVISLRTWASSEAVHIVWRLVDGEWKVEVKPMPAGQTGIAPGPKSGSKPPADKARPNRSDTDDRPE